MSEDKQKNLPTERLFEPKSTTESEPFEPKKNSQPSEFTLEEEVIVGETSLEQNSSLISNSQCFRKSEVVMLALLDIEIIQLKLIQLLKLREVEDAFHGVNDIEIEELEKSGQVFLVNMLNRSLPATLNSRESFELEVAFKVNASESYFSTQEMLQYHVQCFIQNRATGQRKQLENVLIATLSEGETILVSLLSKLIFSQPGYYRLQVVITLDNACTTPKLFEVPFIQVF